MSERWCCIDGEADFIRCGTGCRANGSMKVAAEALGGKAEAKGKEIAAIAEAKITGCKWILRKWADRENYAG